MNCRPMISLLSALLLPTCWIAAQTPPAAQAPPQAAAPATAAPIPAARIAWINLEEAVFKCEEGKRELGEVQSFVTKKNQELQALQKELDNLRSQLQVQAAKLTDEARTDMEQQIDMRDTALQRFQQDTQKEIDSRRNRVTNSVGRKMVPIIEKVAKEKGLSALFYLNSSRDGWVDPSLIITEDIIKAYNQAYPLAAAKPAAANP